jgi:hypothetical protein
MQFMVHGAMDPGFGESRGTVRHISLRVRILKLFGEYATQSGRVSLFQSPCPGMFRLDKRVFVFRRSRRTRRCARQRTKK